MAWVFQTPCVKCDLCLTNLDFGWSLSILRANKSSSQHANKRNFSIKLEGNCSNPTAINVCKRRLMTCCRLCTCSRFGLSSSPNHRLSCIIIDQLPYREFYHTYRYYLRAFYHACTTCTCGPTLGKSRFFLVYYIYTVYTCTRGLQWCLLGFWPLDWNPAGQLKIVLK